MPAFPGGPQPRRGRGAAGHGRSVWRGRFVLHAGATARGYATRHPASSRHAQVVVLHGWPHNGHRGSGLYRWIGAEPALLARGEPC
eukprot:880519-Pyramimonas_sp.AAC.1